MVAIVAHMTRDRARALRRDMTEAEVRLWSRLRDRQIDGLKFRRQHILGAYIADFVCLEKRLVIEVDGDQHAEAGVASCDASRTAHLEADGYRVLRVWNSDVLSNLAGVVDTIAETLRHLPSTPRRARRQPPPPNRA
jgi:very-short-patch-repair endonuclease